MMAVLKILLGLLATTLVGVLSIMFDILPGSSITAQQDLQAQADQKLAAGDFSWARVTINGQKAVVSGNAPSHEEFENAVGAVSAAVWRGGAIVGGVTSVDSTGLLDAERLPLADPFQLTIERQNGALVMAGHAPSENARREIFNLLRESFPGTDISGTLDLAAGAPPESDWLTAVSTSLHALARLDAGAIKANGAKFVLTGTANSEERADVLRKLMSSVPVGMIGVADIEVLPANPRPGEMSARTELETAMASPSDESIPAPDDAAIVSSATAEADACRNRLRGEIDSHSVSFSLSSATITSASRTHLSELGSMMRACPQFSIEITGHTDTTGAEAHNRQLSQRRADAVAAFLTENGVSAQRLSARGVGSAEPLADNRTRDGRQRNRRIDLDLIFDPQ